MSKCANCGATMSCGCQRRTLANGKQGCSKCISAAGKPLKTATNYNNLKDNLDNLAPVVNTASLNKKD
jgi:hypothetical protein